MPKHEQQQTGSETDASGGVAPERPLSAAAGDAVPAWEASTLQDIPTHTQGESTTGESAAEERAGRARTSAGRTSPAESVSEPAAAVPIVSREDKPAIKGDAPGPSGAETSGGSRRTSSSSAPRPRRRTVAVVEDNLRPRVEKLRDASIVRLDEAAEDSGLSFVIIAVVMFLLFLLFLLMSKMLG